MKIFKSLLHLFYPHNCIHCHEELLDKEKFICFTCADNMPRTFFENQKENPTEKTISQRDLFKNAFSYLYFNKNALSQSILHEIKYKRNKSLAIDIGEKVAVECQTFFKNYDVLIPVPLNWRKEAKRGFNQSALIAKGISNITHIPLAHQYLSRTKNTDTQTKKSRKERIENVKDAFLWQHVSQLEEKHILLIDDVITTGATIESILEAGKEYELKISFFTLAIAIES